MNTTLPVPTFRDRLTRWRYRWLNPRRLTDFLAHGYIWLGMLIFVLPFLALLNYSLQKGGGYSLSNFRYVFGSFLDNLLTSFKVSSLAIVINFLIAMPAAYAIVRFEFPGKKLLLTVLTLSLYVPAAVLGIGLVFTYNFAIRLSYSIWALVFAMVVGTYPLMLMPIIVALKDLPEVYEEAALCLGATRLYTFFRVVLPLIGPGISAGVLLTFVIVFNEYLVTLFVAPPGITTAPLRVFNLVRTAGIQNTTAALAVTMQLVSFVAVLAFLRAFGSRYLRGTYLF